MGDMVLEAVVGDVVERVISLAVDEIGLLLCVKGEVKNLRTVLTNIQAVLQDAEERQVKERTVKVWLQELKQVAYDAEDVLDEIAYKKLKYEIINKASRWFSPSRLIVHVKMAHKIKAINGRLDVIEKNKNMFQLEPNQSGSSSLDQMITYDRETCAYVNYSNVFGRGSEKEAIIKKLINDDESSSSTGNNVLLPVIAIVGLGGLGKSTLAQLVYNDAVVGKHFELRVWICVSTNFRTTNLFFQIIQQINRNNTKPESSSKQVLLDELKSQLEQQGTKKLLLVLDDDWNVDQKKWEVFVDPLGDFVATGSKIIVTSRDSNVASIRGAQTVHVHKLQGLSEDSCWDIIKSRAFKKGEREKASLVEIGKQISKKCKGVPLAAKVLGGLLQSKKEDREWKAVRDAEFWNLPSDGTEQILEVLKLSYYNLPSTLRSCFSYCAIFPKDYWISKALLIELWMAQGLLGAGEVMEDVGNTYFNILYSKSFFQEAEINEYKEVIRCKMHDLVNDLAQSICKFECQNFGESNTMRAVDFSRCRHPPVISPQTAEDLCKAKKLRTIFGWRSSSIEFDNGGTVAATKMSTFFKFKLLRVLDLSGFRGYDFSSSSLDKLKHLRYLDLSEMSIELLPKWVTRLYQLQTLKLINCYKLKELPEDLMNLKKLRHLFIDDYKKWKKVAEAVGELHQLQTLPLFVVCEEDAGRGISVLKNLNNLRGSLEIHRLCLVREVILAKGAKLSDKGSLRKLSLHWDSDDGQSCVGDSQVLKELQPHRNLKVLSIVGFGGVEFPGWVSNGSLLSNLVAMKISDCSRCEHIPSFGELPQLESLEMEKMSSVKRIGSGRGASQSSSSSSSLSYPHLKKLVLRSLPNLEEWSGDAADGILFPSLQSLKVDNVGGMGVVSITTSLTSLTSLYIAECEDLEFLPEGLLLRNNNQLDVVHIWKCPKLQAFREEGILTTNEMMVANSSVLRELKIWVCDALKSIPDLRGFTSLQKLDIFICKELEMIPKGFLSSLVALEFLKVGSCDRLKGTIELSPNLKHLRELKITSCPNFEGFDSFTSTEQQQLALFPCCHTLQIGFCDAISSIDVQSFASLCKLDIMHCSGLQALQGLSFLTALETLIIGGFSTALRYFPPLITEDDDDDAVGVGSNNPLLPSLRDLWIWDWNTLQSLPECLGNLASLEKLKILSCENLRHLLSKEQMQRLTFLKQLDISLCHAISSIDVGSFASLRQLEVTRCSAVKALEGLPFLTALEKLVLGPFSEDLDCFPLFLGADNDDNSGEVTLITPLLPSLRELEIKGWPAIQSLPRDLQHLTMLTSLSIRHFNGLKELPEWLGNLASLVTLKIWDCENLTYLPSKEQMHQLTLLKELSISECGRLHYNCFTYGPEWPKISHIPYVVII